MWRNRVKFPAPASGPGQVPIIVDICGLKRQIGVPALILSSPSNFPIKWEDRNKLHSLYLFLLPRNSINLIWFSQLTAPTGRNSWNWFYSSHFRVEEAELAWMVSSRARLGSLCLNPTPVRSPAPMIPSPYAPGAMDLLQVSHPPLPPSPFLWVSCYHPCFSFLCAWVVQDVRSCVEACKIYLWV